MALDLLELLPADWRAAMLPHLDRAAVTRLAQFVEHEYASGEIFPPLPDLFAAFRLCPVDEMRVLILGQDPYHRAGQAHGLSFSVRPGVTVPPSLRNVVKELRTDLGVEIGPKVGDLTPWARQGVLLLNAVLTVRAGAPGSHAGKGWEQFTDAAILAANGLPERVVFLLWGSSARKKASLVTAAPHVVIEAGHPSPMNREGFLGTRPFSACDQALRDAGRPPVDWRLTGAESAGGGRADERAPGRRAG